MKKECYIIRNVYIHNTTL